MEEKGMQHGGGPSKYRRIVPVVYIVTLAVIAIMVCMSAILKDTHRADHYGLDGFLKVDTGWHTADGNAFDIEEIDELRREESQSVSIFYTLPSEITKDESIVFRSKNCFVTVLVGGREVYATDVADAPFYNNSPGTRWNVVSIREGSADQTVEIEIQQAYEDGRAKVDNFYYGDRAAIVLHLIGAKVLGCAISLLIFFVALVFLAAFAVLNWHRRPKDFSLLWLAVFGMVAACWCLLETNLFQFFVPDLRLIQVLDNIMLVVGGMPLYLYMDSVYGVFRHRFIRVLCALNAFYLVLATLSQILGLWDYHQTLNGAVATYAIVIIILIGCLIQQHMERKAHLTEHARLFDGFQQIGILLLGLGILGDLIRYLTSDVLDRAFIIRIGLLGFVIFFGAGNIYQMTLLVKKGMEADFISQLAYSDGLTKVGNRTAYLERVEHLKKKHPGDQLVLVMFDINSLKWVNDTLGHKAGDDLILRSAEILKSTFSAPWTVYRIGGDEFVALNHGGDMHARYEKAEACFQEQIRRVNEMERRDYPVAIAHGAAFCQGITKQTVETAEREADLSMYEEKYRMKCAQPE